MISRRFVMAAVILASVAGVATSQVKNTDHTLRLAEGAESPAATINQFSWLTGYWVGEGFGGVGEEMWSQPMANTMLGTFRLVNDGKLSFSEIMMLSVKDGSASMRLKHFDSNLKGWEKKDEFLEFKLVKLGKDAAWFDGLTYQLKDDGSLLVFVAMKQDDGKVEEGKFVFRRKKLSA